MTELLSSASIGLVKRVPSGQVRLGSRFHPREMPRRTVRVPEFEMAHTVVTVNQYRVFVECGAPNEQRWWTAGGWVWRQGQATGWGRADRSQPEAWERQGVRPHHPVVGVTRFEADAYCAWLAHHKQQRVRLPTEEEWERAGRGDDDRPFPWGEYFDAALTNTLETGLRDTVPAASLEGDLSPFGILELAGNVQEWTASPYQPGPREEYASAELGVARGGSFNDTAFGARASYRRAYPPGYFYPYLGFRIVVTHR